MDLPGFFTVLSNLSIYSQGSSLDSLGFTVFFQLLIEDWKQEF